ncbi:MAG: substrate-binding domain-containing protein [Verrucomicrobia bacterium]|nr:substrate-binding domain-containing protein [Verrucomicrobiota bacterium]
MKFIQSRVEQLADHLRERIARGEFSSPLPSIRDWSGRLGVAHCTLENALKILKRDGLVRTQPQKPRKGSRLARKTRVRKVFRHPPLVRWLTYGRFYRDIPTQMEIFMVLNERLSLRGIRLSLEACSDSRLNAIHREGPRDDQMLALHSFSWEMQELFDDFKMSALLIGQPFPKVRLPFVTMDVLGAIRHATWLLARRGFHRISLVISKKSKQPIEEQFRRICAEPSPSVQDEVIRLPEEFHEQNCALRRLAARVTGNQAFIVNSPIPAALLMMALMKRGVDVPGQVEVIAMNATLAEARTFPLITYYPYPMERFSKALCQAAAHYFERGELPPLKLVIPLRMVAPPNA